MRSLDKDPLYRNLLLSLPMREATGTATTRDVANPHHPMTLNSSPPWVKLSTGLYVLQFAAGDSIQCAAASCADLGPTSGALSASAWVYPTTLGATPKTILAKINGGASEGWWFLHDATSSRYLQFYDPQGGGKRTYTGVALDLNVWQLVGFYKSGTTLRVFVNGRDATSVMEANASLAASAADDFYVGYYTGGSSFTGSMWNPRVWGRALAPSEHMQIFNQERHLFGV